MSRHFLLYSESLDDGFDAGPHHRLKPYGLQSPLFTCAVAVGCKKPIIRILEGSLAEPGLQIRHCVLIDWHWFLRSLGLAFADNLVHHGPLDINLQLFKADIFLRDS